MIGLIFVFAGCERKKDEGLRKYYPQNYTIKVLLYSGRELEIKQTSDLKIITYDTKETIKLAPKSPEDFISIRSDNMDLNIDELPIHETHMVVTSEKNIFNLNGESYRGRLHIYFDPNSRLITAVNEIQTEDYLAGVIGAEMPSYWEPQALKAQSVAARTYCIYIKNKFGKSRKWDVKKTQANQVYKGMAAESAQVWQAINETHGEVISAKKNDGTFEIFPAYYSSVCGGHTEPSQNVFGGEVYQPLKGVECPYCRISAKEDFWNWSYSEPNSEQIFDMLVKSYPNISALGSKLKYLVSRKSDYEDFSRATGIKLISDSGKTEFLRAEDFRLAIDPSGLKIKSTCFIISDVNDKICFLNGRGFGHGVGLCQSGCQQMAREGKDYKQIIDFYYPESKIINIYENE